MVDEHIVREVFFAMFPPGTRVLWWDDEALQPGKVVGREETEHQTVIFFRLDTDDGRARRRCEWQHRSRIVLEPTVEKGEVGAETILRIVASHFGLDPREITGRAREKLTVQARHIAAHLIRQETDLTLKQTGAVLGGRSPATISYAYGTISVAIQQDDWVRGEVEKISRSLHR